MAEDISHSFNPDTVCRVREKGVAMKHRLFIGLFLLYCAALALMIIDGIHSVKSSASGMSANSRLVKHFLLTDLALWTEARYTRHPSQADIFSPFQDFPGAMEHFPSGSIVAPSGIIVSQQQDP